MKVDWLRFQVIRIATPLLVMIGWAMVVATAVYILPREAGRLDLARDSPPVWMAVERLQSGGPLYLPIPTGPIPPPEAADWFYTNPPVLAPVLSLLPRASWPTWSATWTSTLFIVFGLYVAALVRLATGHLTWHRWAAGVYLAMIYPGTREALSYANVDVVVWTLAGWAVVRPGWFRGVALAWAAVLKPYVLFALIFAAARDRRVAMGAALGFTSAAILSSMALGLPGFISACTHWVTEIAPRLGAGHTVYPNHSLSFVIATIVGVDWLATVIGISVPVATAFALRHHPPAVQLAWTLALAVMASPYLLGTYLPLTALALAVEIGAAPSGRARVFVSHQGELERLPVARR